jgi:hypothetical protein
MKDTEYNFHQTPKELAKDLIKYVDFALDDIVLEPFKGEGAFYDVLPSIVQKHWCEIEEGRDWMSYTGDIDWVVSNPPFRLDNDGKRENAYFKIMNYYSTRVRKGIAFLGNDYCLSCLTPIRMKILNDNGIYLNKIVMCNVKQWRGRYFFMIFEKSNKNLFHYLPGNYAK